jgi:eukaryotic-like serine/threonine-protein kinase
MAKKKTLSKQKAPARRRNRKAPEKQVRVVLDTCLPETKVSKRLQIGEVVGKGGMAMISAAYDTNLNRPVARKELRPEFVADESLAGGLVIEAQITAQLDHPNIVPVYELGVDKKNNVFFTMKLVNGRTLTEMLDLKPPKHRTAEDLFSELQVFLKVCDAVAFAHSKGVIHQDLKPDNIMVGEFGEVYLMDWGFARIKGQNPSKVKAEPSKARKRKQLKVTQKEGFVAATPHYLAPEFTTGERCDGDELTDIFCLGGILYRILTGKPPFHGKTMKTVTRKALMTQIDPPEKLAVIDVPTRLSGIAMKALSKEPAERYQTVTDLKGDVERFLQCGWQFQRKRFKAGEVIVREGEPGWEAYIVTTGECAVYRGDGDDKMILDEIGVGDVFGELAIFAGQPRNATVEALTDVSVMVLEKRHFDQDLGMSFWLGVVVKALAERFLDVSDELAELKKRTRRRSGQ